VGFTDGGEESPWRETIISLFGSRYANAGLASDGNSRGAIKL